METTNDVCDAVVSAVAEAEGVEPDALDESLGDVVDPDALRSLFATTPGGTTRDGTLTFTFCGYTVTVDGTGSVTVTDPSEPASSATGTA